MPEYGPSIEGVIGSDREVINVGGMGRGGEVQRPPGGVPQVMDSLVRDLRLITWSNRGEKGKECELFVISTLCFVKFYLAKGCGISGTVTRVYISHDSFDYLQQ